MRDPRQATIAIGSNSGALALAPEGARVRIRAWCDYADCVGTIVHIVAGGLCADVSLDKWGVVRFDAVALKLLGQ